MKQTIIDQRASTDTMNKVIDLFKQCYKRCDDPAIDGEDMEFLEWFLEGGKCHDNIHSDRCCLGWEKVSKIVRRIKSSAKVGYSRSEDIRLLYIIDEIDSLEIDIGEIIERFSD